MVDEEECPRCDGTGYIDNPEYRTDRDAMALACPDCDDDWYCWEEQDFMENKLFYENDLEHLEELPSKEKHR